MTCGIYKITNNINGKIYIGQSIDIERRFKQHLKKSNTPDKQKTSIKFIYEGVCYNSIRECSRITGINRRTIGRYIKRCQK